MRSRLLAAAALLALTAGLTACGSADGASSGPVPGDGPLVAFYGDSYTLGTGASDQSERWSTVISEERGWREFNPSVNGLGFINHRDRFGEDSGDLPSLIIAERPDIVFVTMGLNDAFSYDREAERIHTQIDTDLHRLKDALPDARFIVVEPFWYTDERPQAIETIIDWVADAAADIGADTIPGASHWIEGHPEWMASDGLHPNDDGYREMAKRMDAELERLGL